MSLDQLTPGTWNLDASHSTVGFTVRHMMVSKVRGTFADFSTSVEIAADPLQSTLSADVKMASISTGDDGRDQHLRTNDFFDVEQHPTMTFRSTSFRRDGADFVMVGDLTIKGITRTVEFALEFGGVGQDPWGNTRAGFTATTTINRRDFGVEWNAPLETGGVLVADKVAIELDIEIVKA
jgi:polyisoprenoid-binding protein YceI